MIEFEVDVIERRTKDVVQIPGRHYHYHGKEKPDTLLITSTTEIQNQIYNGN